jgi:Fungal specific transcription factor domain
LETRPRRYNRRFHCTLISLLGADGNNLGSVIYHGPSSVYNTDVLSWPKIDECHTQFVSFPSLPGPAISLDDPVVRECLAQFPRSQYPYSMIVDQDEFLLCFSSSDQHEEHNCLALAYAMCALGALMSPDLIIKDMANDFYTAARRILMRRGMVVPHVTSIQALLCCAFYAAGKGNVSESWQYSGELHENL